MTPVKQLGYVFGALILAACVQLGSPAPDQQFYLLEVDSDRTRIQSDRAVVLAIDLAGFPDYLKRAPVVAKGPNHQIRFSDTHRWAEPLDSALVATLQRSLQLQLPAATILVHPWENPRLPDYRLRLTVIDFSGVLGETLDLRIRWQLSDNNGHLWQGTYSDNRSTGNSYGDLVAALNAGVNAFSKNVGKMLAN